MDDNGVQERKRVVLVTRRRATGESLAAACRARGVTVTVIGPEQTESFPGAVVVLDLIDGHGLAAEDLSAVTSTAARVVVMTSEATDVPGVAAHQRIDPKVSLHEFLEVLRGADEPCREWVFTSPTGRRDALTEREREVLTELLADGDTDSMAARLGISANTVRTHLQNVLTKLGVNSRAEAASWALREGLVPSGSGRGSTR